MRLQKGRERSLKRFHPWVYSGAVESADAGVASGDMIEVLDAAGNFLGCGFYADASIAIKMFSFKKAAPDQQYWNTRIAHAKSFRDQHGLTPASLSTNAFRLVNAEGDGIPGLIIDIYGDAAVIQCHSAGAYQLLDVWKEALDAAYGPLLSTIYSKSAETLKSEDGESIAVNQFLLGDQSQVTAKEDGLSFRVNFEEGQKTGFFIDQRDSRSLTRRLAAGKRVLNLFCYSGGFSIAALAGDAAHVTSVDVSAPALALLAENIELNGFSGRETRVVEDDCFHFLENEQNRYDLIIVDPPPFAKSRAALERALQGYRALNNLALKRLEKHGTMLTFSCSQVVGSDLFQQAIRDAGVETGKQLRVISELSSPFCHPVSIYHPEGRYLKGLHLVSDN